MVDSTECLDCHDDLVSEEDFVGSAHGGNGCTSCHLAGMQLDKHMEGEVEIEDVRCERCHAQETADYVDSVHADNGVECISCHSDIHDAINRKGDKKAVVDVCMECHDD
ncbi:MAG: cytochrome C, partial [Desulfuromonadales bacterium]|nr:cytochrome C [Desulfuromonadales bacterium]